MCFMRSRVRLAPAGQRCVHHHAAANLDLACAVTFVFALACAMTFVFALLTIGICGRAVWRVSAAHYSPI